MSPSVKNGPLTEEEQKTIIQLQAIHGNKWSLMASLLPGRSDNTIKNFWNSYRKRAIRRQQALKSIQKGKAFSNIQSPHKTHIGQLDEKLRTSESLSGHGTESDDGNFEPEKSEFNNGNHQIMVESAGGGDIHSAVDQEDVLSSLRISQADLLQQMGSSQYESGSQPMDTSIDEPSGRIEDLGQSSQPSEVETMEQKRMRYLLQAKHIWERILASPTGMCAALRDTMPPILLATSGFLQVDQQTGQAVSMDNQAAPPQIDPQTFNVQNFAFGGASFQRQESSTSQSFEMREEPQKKIGDGDLNDLVYAHTKCEVLSPKQPPKMQPPQIPLSLSDAEETLLSGLASPPERNRVRSCKSLRPMEVRVQRNEFRLPESFLTPDGMLGKTLISPNLAALIVSPKIDLIWDGSKLSPSFNFR